ncbi:MAG: shikimate kinase [Raoultibacter sp.]
MKKGNKNRAGNGGHPNGRPSRDCADKRAKQRPHPCDNFVFLLRQRVFFIGFMGAGKTSIARRCARDCNLVAVDMDSYLERSRECRVRTLFTEYGEEAFRELEHEVLLEVSEMDPLFISCGGGIITRPDNRALLHDEGFVIYLNVSADEASRRIRDISSRPLFKDIDAARKINAERKALYAGVADATIDTSGKSVARIANEARKLLLRKGVLCQQPK